MFKRIANFFRGMLGLAINDLEMSKPEALLEVEKENLRKQIGRYNQGLAAHAALVEKLMGQIKRQEKEEKELLTKAAAHLKAGNQDVAGQYAIKLKNLREELGENRSQLEASEGTYKELTRARDVSIAEARKKIEELKLGIKDMEIQKATAELNEMASGLVTELGGAGETLSRLEEMVNEEREKAAGRSRVARDSMNMDDIKIKETEQKAMQDMALADLAAELGESVSSSNASSGDGGAAETQSENNPTEKEGM